MEKLKQEKVWDFTVRGWQAADISGNIFWTKKSG
jgi:hypothetical protein